MNISYGALSTYLTLCSVPNVLLDQSGLYLVASKETRNNMDLNKTVIYILSQEEVYSRLCGTLQSLYSAHNVPGYFCLSGLLSLAYGFCPQGCLIVATVAPAITSRQQRRRWGKGKKTMSLHHCSPPIWYFCWHLMVSSICKGEWCNFLAGHVATLHIAWVVIKEGEGWCWV